MRAMDFLMYDRVTRETQADEVIDYFKTHYTPGLAPEDVMDAAYEYVGCKADDFPADIFERIRRDVLNFFCELS